MIAVRKMDHGPGQLTAVEIEEPAVTPGMVKIKVAYAGICGSDLHILEGYEPPGNPLPMPVTLGHEFSGVVSEVGAGVTQFKVGDRVTAYPATRFCGKCKACLSGLMAFCSQERAIGYETDGAMTEYICMEEGVVFKLPDSMTLEEGAQVEPACVAAAAVFDNQIKPGDVSVVLGAGPIGLLTMQFIKASGGIAIVSDLSKMANKLELAKEYGADAVLPNDQCDLVSEVKKMTGGRGADFVFECTGVDACINQAIMMTRFKGTVVELALTNMKGSMLQAYPAVSLNAIRIQGSFGHTIGIWPRVISLMSSGKVKTAELVSHKYNFEECEQAFACNGPDKVKILLHP